MGRIRFDGQPLVHVLVELANSVRRTGCRRSMTTMVPGHTPLSCIFAYMLMRNSWPVTPTRPSSMLFLFNHRTDPIRIWVDSTYDPER